MGSIDRGNTQICLRVLLFDLSWNFLWSDCSSPRAKLEQGIAEPESRRQPTSLGLARAPRLKRTLKDPRNVTRDSFYVWRRTSKIVRHHVHNTCMLQCTRTHAHVVNNHAHGGRVNRRPRALASAIATTVVATLVVRVLLVESILGGSLPSFQRPTLPPSHSP